MRIGLLLLLLIFLIAVFSRDFVLFFIALLIYLGAKLLGRRNEEEY